MSAPLRPLPAVEHLEPIGLAALDAAAALQRRFDTKYLLPRDEVSELLGRLQPTHQVLEANGLRQFDYRTTYFDTEELGAFRDHLQGRRRRLKVRVRHYLDTGDCFFELKFRGARDCTMKRRAPHDPRRPRSLGTDSLAVLERWVQDAYGRPAPGPLVPVLEVTYTRATLVSPEHGERLTIDLDLRMWPTGADGWGRLDPDLAIVETKSAHGPTLAGRRLRALGARPLNGMSKYCLGVVLTLGRARGNTLLPVMRHCAGRHSPTGVSCAP